MRELSLSGSLPGNDLNGLIPIVKHLIDAPAESRVAIVLYDVQSLKTKVDDGLTMPVVRLRAIEPITDPAVVTKVRQTMNDIYCERTGKMELDLDYQHEYDDE